MYTSAPAVSRPLAPFSVRSKTDPPPDPPPPNTDAMPPLLSCNKTRRQSTCPYESKNKLTVHVCDDKPLWFTMSSPGTSAIVAPWSIGSWHLLRRIPNAQRKLGSSNASGGKTCGFASNTESLSRVHVPLTYESYPAAVSSSWVPRALRLPPRSRRGAPPGSWAARRRTRPTWIWVRRRVRAGAVGRARSSRLHRSRAGRRVTRARCPRSST